MSGDGIWNLDVELLSSKATDEDNTLMELLPDFVFDRNAQDKVVSILDRLRGFSTKACF